MALLADQMRPRLRALPLQRCQTCPLCTPALPPEDDDSGAAGAAAAAAAPAQQQQQQGPGEPPAAGLQQQGQQGQGQQPAYMLDAVEEDPDRELHMFEVEPAKVGADC